MKLGFVLRNMGAASDPAIVAAVARAADATPGIDDLWVVDHIAIPPDQAEGSNGRYLDPLATLAWVAGCTTRVGLGTGVLVLPYRPALPTAKWVATIQELSGGRLLLGVGVGWMEAEFRAAGVDRRSRGRLSDEVLAFIDRCFAADDDVAEANGQAFLFRPRPPRPPIFVGGSPANAWRRALAHRGGWMPIGVEPEALREPAQRFRADAAAQGMPEPEIVVMTGLPLDDPPAAGDRLAAFAAAGATRVVHGGRYADLAGGQRALDALAGLR
jgi:probable F420-dependent oxidoreductase